MKEGQEKIYYLLAPTPAAAASSPLLETFRKQGVEVLLFGEAVITGWPAACRIMTAKRLVSAGQEVPDFGGGEERGRRGGRREAAAGFAGLTAKLKGARRQGPRGAGVEPADHVAGLHRAGRAGDRPEPDAADQRQRAP
jgi:molecular chaperone HtpG